LAADDPPTLRGLNGAVKRLAIRNPARVDRVRQHTRF
jgi:hypothetical protein